MKKKVWIVNHYAINQFNNEGGRHYWFAQNLIMRDYEPTIFCANTRHNSEDVINTEDSLYVTKVSKNIPFTFVKTKPYNNNGINRVKNMFTFYKNLFPVSKSYSEKYGKPDVILASSVHPLTLVAGIKIAKKFNIPCICEVRDLWPETLVAYGSLKKGSLLSKFLYLGEKWIYTKADKLIFTMEGGKDYLTKNGWNLENGGPINSKKVKHINNGIDLSDYYNKKNEFQIYDPELENENTFKIIYTGSIRLVNKVEKILEVAKILSNQNIKFLVWGNGDQLDILKNRVINEKISNVTFKGRVDKKYIPYINSKAQLNIILGESLHLYQYGGSMNKIFDYLAAGKPILSTFKMGYSIIDKYNSGLELENGTAEEIAKSILYFKDLKPDQYEKYCINARNAAEEYDFNKLTESLIDIIES